jgi:hypothetical protein
MTIGERQANPLRRQLDDPGSMVRRTIRGTREWLQRLSPSGFVPLSSGHDPASVAIVCVYRARNAAFVRGVLDALPTGTEVRLWALDDVVDDLAAVTHGRGPGGRTSLLNSLVASLPAHPDVLLVMDDDFEVIIGDARRLLRAGSMLGFDAYQPAHSRRSTCAFPFLRKRPLLFARETTFVEQGPLVALTRRAQDALLPLPDELVMGWGVEVRWFDAARRNGLRYGVIDAVAIRHDWRVTRRSYEYDTASELERLEQELAAVGKSDVRELQQTVHSITSREAWRRGR